MPRLEARGRGVIHIHEVCYMYMGGAKIRGTCTSNLNLFTRQMGLHMGDAEIGGTRSRDLT